MRLSFILSSLRLSGGVFVVIEYAKRLTALGYEIQLVVPKGTTDPEIVSDLGERITIQEASIGIPPIKFLQLTQFIHLIFSLAWVTPKSDVIIATHTPTTIPALIASYILRKGESLWLYQDYLEMFTGRPYESWLVKNALRWFNCALVVSEYSKFELKRNSPGRVVYVGEGLSHSELFHPLTPEHRITRGNKKIILTLGDPRQRKGFYDFLDAVEMVYENIPNIEF